MLLRFLTATCLFLLCAVGMYAVHNSNLHVFSGAREKYAVAFFNSSLFVAFARMCMYAVHNGFGCAERIAATNIFELGLFCERSYNYESKNCIYM